MAKNTSSKRNFRIVFLAAALLKMKRSTCSHTTANLIRSQGDKVYESPDLNIYRDNQYFMVAVGNPLFRVRTYYLFLDESEPSSRKYF